MELTPRTVDLLVSVTDDFHPIVVHESTQKSHVERVKPRDKSRFKKRLNFAVIGQLFRNLIIVLKNGIFSANIN